MPSIRLREADLAGAHVVELEGELDLSAVRSVQRPLLEVVSDHDRLVLDCMGLTFIDSTGMRLLLSILRVVSRREGRLVIACANPTILRLFEVTGLERTFDVRHTLEDAVAKACDGVPSGA